MGHIFSVPLNFVVFALGSVLAAYLFLQFFSLAYLTWAQAANKAGRLKIAIARAERLAKLGELVPRQPQLLALYYLVCWYLNDRQYQRSLDTADRLETMTLPASLVIDVKRRKSECYEALGRPEQARSEIREAQISAANAGNDRHKLVAQASLLNNQKRPGEAYQLFSQAFALTPITAREERDKLLAQLMSSAHLSGRIPEVLPWAQMLLAESNEPQYICMANRMAAVACSDMGNLGEAERYAKDGIEYARKANRRQDLSQALSYYATLVVRRPDPEAALPLFEEAIAADPENAYQSHLAQGEAFYALGRFAEGVKTIELGRSRINVPLPSGQKRLDALLLLAKARGYFEMGQAEEAIRTIDMAAPQFTDQKMSIWCDAMYAIAFAEAGKLDRAAAKVLMVHARRMSLPDDNGLQRTCLSFTCRASILLGDIENAQKYADEYLERGPSPSDMARAYFLQAECAAKRDDNQRASEFYRKAAAVHRTLYFSRLAQERLSSIPS